MATAENLAETNNDDNKKEDDKVRIVMEAGSTMDADEETKAPAEANNEDFVNEQNDDDQKETDKVQIETETEAGATMGAIDDRVVISVKPDEKDDDQSCDEKDIDAEMRTMQEELEKAAKEFESRWKLQNNDLKQKAPGKFQQLLAKVPKALGAFLQRALYASYILHFHVFICVLAPALCCEEFCWEHNIDECFQIFVIVLGLSSMFATPFVVTIYLINHVFEVYSEIQSWEISYIIWGCSCGVLCTIGLICSYTEREATFQNGILYPFGISVKNRGDTSLWVVPLVSMAVSIVGGFFANYALAERHLLKCDPSFTEGLCHDGLCCLPISSHEITESSRFLGDLASNILAGWAVVSGIAYFIIKNDDEVVADDKSEERIYEILETKQKVTEILEKKVVKILKKKGVEFEEQDENDDDSYKKEREILRKLSHEIALRDPDSRRSSIDTSI